MQGRLDHYLTYYDFRGDPSGNKSTLAFVVHLKWAFLPYLPVLGVVKAGWQNGIAQLLLTHDTLPWRVLLSNVRYSYGRSYHQTLYNSVPENHVVREMELDHSKLTPSLNFERRCSGYSDVPCDFAKDSSLAESSD